ncbi:MAG TPA: RsmG family class I SAM-dependent methyltransferase [Acidimicrobiia bacterium]
MKPLELWKIILDSAGLDSEPGILSRLSTYQEWLATEGVAGGGISPGDVDRLADRHIGDSLLYSLVIEAPTSILDVGSGIGLPGIPLAIVYPAATIVCLDRSGRRADLANRAIRVLELDNVEAVQGEVEGLTSRYPTIVSRAAIPPERFRPILREILAPGGRAVLGGSWKTPPIHSGFETIEIGSEILRQPVWILKMSAT